MALFETHELTKRFFGVVALNNVSIEVKTGELVGMIGPNGSGKTTLFNCVTKCLDADRGNVMFDGEDISRARPAEIARKGIARTFQIIRVFPDLTVRDNILLAAQHHQPDNELSRFLRTSGSRKFESEARGRASDMLDFIGLNRLADDKAGTLSYGQRKLLSFASAMIFNPRLVLLDEPAAAVNPTMINKIEGLIRELNGLGITFVIVEHNMEFIMGLASRIIVLDQGQVIAEGPPYEIQRNKAVQEAYFGV